MRAVDSDLVVAALRRPDAPLPLSLAQWDLLVRQARSAGLLARLASQYQRHGSLAAVPPAPAAHLLSAVQVASAQQAEARREVAHLQRALALLAGPLVLLKGAAYLMADLPAASGRIFSDTDLLVRKAQLPEVEAALMLAGWAGSHHSAYDQRYYRQWMHELPPMMHLKRQTAVDVHHAIAPDTARLRPPVELLWADIVEVPGQPGLAMLSPCDMVLHSMLHLLVNDDLSHGLRDLSDLDLLLRHFSAADPDFWAALQQRAQRLGLQRILYYGLRAVSGLLQTPVPAPAMAEAVVGAPAWPLRPVMDAAWARVLRAPHASVRDGFSATAQTAMYLRAHALRMPPGLLARHLFVKAFGLHVTAAEREAAKKAAAP